MVIDTNYLPAGSDCIILSRSFFRFRGNFGEIELWKGYFLTDFWDFFWDFVQNHHLKSWLLFVFFTDITKGDLNHFLPKSQYCVNKTSKVGLLTVSTKKTFYFDFKWEKDLKWRTNELFLITKSTFWMLCNTGTMKFLKNTFFDQITIWNVILVMKKWLLKNGVHFVVGPFLNDIEPKSDFKWGEWRKMTWKWTIFDHKINILDAL